MVCAECHVIRLASQQPPAYKDLAIPLIDGDDAAAEFLHLSGFASDGGRR